MKASLILAAGMCLSTEEAPQPTHDNDVIPHEEPSEPAIMDQREVAVLPERIKVLPPTLNPSPFPVQRTIGNFRHAIRGRLAPSIRPRSGHRESQPSWRPAPPIDRKG